MTVTHTWSVEKLEHCPQLDNQVDVVTTIHWSLATSDGAQKVTAYSSVDVPYATNGTFTPYDQLTQAQVISWVQTKLGPTQVIELEKRGAEDVLRQANAPTAVSALPWK